ncbi:hypothetical protein SanaruYs_39360 [Chryseotalea sanaruensis]|uniref:Uncharacterized protein n=1 Tax=Chryseotalea sanaruensis TaxID=2482724 RepID=A0A401UFL1_9BACT|nr:hypothetical protein [Chryseotalea sanaruensis]GCC53691.1 hypothetical protein SanaruYs_39360 [Chryseotalea sanaruensis]
MKELSILLVVCLFGTVGTFAQDKKDFNLILVIDDIVWVSYTNLKIEIRDDAGSLKQTIGGLYYPGNLSFDKDEYEKLLAAKNDSMTLVIDYKEPGKNENKHQVFELPFSSSWLYHYFMIMRVYNLSNKKYMGVFDPLDKSRNYTFEIDYPGGQMLRVRNKIKKK